MALVNEKAEWIGSYLETLLNGDRPEAREFIESSLEKGFEPSTLLNELLWPAMEHIQALYREDKITLSSLNLATRLNRSLTDQLTGKLERKEANGKTVLIFCGDDEPEELGGQICADLFEADGWCVRFAGGGVPNDEILRMIGAPPSDSYQNVMNAKEVELIYQWFVENFKKRGQ